MFSPPQVVCRLPFSRFVCYTPCHADQLERNPSYPSVTSGGLGELLQAIQDIGSALLSGDISTAQGVLGTFQQAQLALPGGSATSVSQPFGDNTQLNTGYQNLTSTLQSGNLANARQAFATLQSDLPAAQKSPRHHYRHTSTTASSSSSAAASSTAPAMNASSTQVASGALDKVA